MEVEQEAVAVVHILPVDHQPVGHDPLVLALPGGRGSRLACRGLEGDRRARAAGVPDLVGPTGMASRSSLPKFVPSVTDLVSTTGLSPVTVTVSSTVDSASFALISALNPASMRMPWLTCRLKPESSKRTV